MRDWGDIGDDIEPAEQVEVGFTLNNNLKELEESGFYVFGMIKKQKYTFPFMESSGQNVIPLLLATIYVAREDNPTIIKAALSKESIYVKNGG